MARNRIGGAVLIAVILALVPLSVAQESTSAAKPDARTNSAPAENENPSTSLEGIKVHGHWTIEVRNPDGSLASHTEFDNALLQSGAILLADFLGRVSIPGNWLVFLMDSGQAGACGSGLNNPPLKCAISEANDPPSSNLIQSNTLNVTTATPANAGPQLILAGNVTAMFSSSVVVVETALAHCHRTANAIPRVCGIYGSTPTFLGSQSFSHAALPNPVPVSAGQMIQITITFTFS